MLHTTEITGSGPTIVLLHGVFMDHTLWETVVPRLGDRHVVTVDMPGHGFSPGMEAGSHLETHVAAVVDTLDRIGVERAVLAGHSWGGMTALRIAHLRPDLVGGLVLTNTPLLRTSGVDRLGFGAQRAMLAVGLPLSWYAGPAAKALHGPGHLQVDRGAAPGLELRLRRMGRVKVARTIRSVILEPTDAVGLLESLELPLAVVGGEHDYAMAPRIRARLEAVGIEPIITPGGHTGPREAPIPIADAIVGVAEQVRSAVDR